MLRFLLFPAVLVVAAYAALGGADLAEIIKFGFVLLIALCTALRMGCQNEAPVR